MGIKSIESKLISIPVKHSREIREVTPHEVLALSKTFAEQMVGVLALNIRDHQWMMSDGETWWGIHPKIVEKTLSYWFHIHGAQAHTGQSGLARKASEILLSVEQRLSNSKYLDTIDSVTPALYHRLTFTNVAHFFHENDDGSADLPIKPIRGRDILRYVGLTLNLEEEIESTILRYNRLSRSENALFASWDHLWARGEYTL